MKITACSSEYASQILDIFNDAILNTTALYDYKPWTMETMKVWFATKEQHNFPVIGIVDDENRLLGFGSYGQFRLRPAYKYTIENSVYVHRDHRGKGLGKLLLQEIIKQQPENAKVLNYLGYSYAERNIKLDDAEKLLIKVTELYPNDPAFLDSLAWLYYRTGKYTQAEKYIFMAINTHPQLFDYTLYEHLGDISIELNKLPQAWLAYAVSCDIGSKPAKTKMKLIEKKVSPDEINKVTAERAVHNFIRIAALNAGYKLKIKSNNVKVNSYLSVLYGNQFGIKAGVAPKLAMPEINVYFSKGNIKFEPQAARDSLPEDVLAMFDFASFLFSKDFVKMLYSSAIKQKGNTLSYENEKYIIKINRKDGMFKEFILKDLLSLKISSYKQFNKISKVPAKMIFSSRKTNFICDMQLNKISFPDEEDFIPFKDMRNDSKSAGKN